MKALIFIFSFFLVFSCGSRKRELNKGSEKTSFENIASVNSETKFENVNFHEGSLSELLENQNLKISSNGTPYELRYGSLVFSGSADIEFSNQKQDVKKEVKTYNKTFYYYKTTYKTQTKYQTQNRTLRDFLREYHLDNYHIVLRRRDNGTGSEEIHSGLDQRIFKTKIDYENKICILCNRGRFIL